MLNEAKRERLFAALEEVYRAMPAVSCRACGECCTSPNITLVEFLYFVERTRAMLGETDWAARITQSLDPHPAYAENYRCVFQDEDNRCAAHAARSFICRLHGHPIINTLQIRNQENCRYLAEREVMAGISQQQFDGWLQTIEQLNRQLYDWYSPPFFLTGLPLAAWFDLMHLKIDDDRYLRDIRRNFPAPAMADIADRYVAKTRIYEKLRIIRKLWLLIEFGEIEKVELTARSLIRDYPETGTHFMEIANQIIIRLAASGRVSPSRRAAG